MRGVDTNVLVRFVTGDDAKQAKLALDFVEDAERRGESLHIAIPVICELAWVLQGRLYGFDRPAIAAVIERLLEIGVFVVQDRDLVRQAIEDFRDGPADLPDYLIGRQNRRLGCSDTVTFDLRLAGEDGFAALD